MKFVDANIFLELMLDDKKADICESFFEKIKNEETSFYTSDFIIYTCLLQIEQKIKSLKVMGEFIYFINNLNNLHILRPSIKDIYNSLLISKKYKLDFDDALVVSVMAENNIQNLISFDKDFDKVSMIKREEP